MSQLHENLLELLKKLQNAGSIANVIARTIKSVINPDEKILSCFYQLEISQVQNEQETSYVFGNCNIDLITPSRYVSLGFYNNYHHIKIYGISQLDSLDIEHRFATGYEAEGESASGEARNFNPLSVSVKAIFSDQFGRNVAEWNPEVSAPEDIKLLYKETQALSALIGKPLKENAV